MRKEKYFKSTSEDINNNNEKESEKSAFFDVIGRPDLKEVLTRKKPWVYWTMELYRPDNQGGGGLGMLASDTLETAKKLNIPYFFITPFYTKESMQVLDDFNQKTYCAGVSPIERGCELVGGVNIYTVIDGERVPTELQVYKKQEGSVTMAFIFEKNMGLLYQGGNNDDHRLYQETALGFGGVKAMELFGVGFGTKQQLNEAPTVFSAIAQLDRLVCESGDLNKSLKEIRRRMVYTNHTLVQAVEAEFDLEQFERFVLPNLESEEIKKWIREKFAANNGRLKLSKFAIELSGKMNGVSRIHAREASKVYEDFNNNPVEFEPITNGISIDRWGDKELVDLYRKENVLSGFDMPADDYDNNIRNIDLRKLKKIKDNCRVDLRNFLKKCRNQYGTSPEIPKNAKIFNWKRRLAGYKRPGMIFTNANKLAQILDEGNAYLVMAGKVHSSDVYMQRELARILKIIDEHPILKKRVHFIENYNENIAKALARGSDVSLNTPRVFDEAGKRVSTEACGTSFMKDILNLTVLISTPDGGVADIELADEHYGGKRKNSFLKISGDNYNEELNSLYLKMEEALGIVKDDKGKYEFLKEQLIDFLPIISGSRMEKDYLNFGFPAQLGK